MGILDEDVARVRDATDLVALASEHLALKRVGKRFVGLCPFHAEKTPSFNVNPEMGRYYCFGCQASGDAITFVREVEHLDFVDAVERLAARAGITLRYDDKSVAKDKGRKARLSEAVAAAIDVLPAAAARVDRGRHRPQVPAQSRASTATRRVSSSSAGRPTVGTALSVHLQQQKFARDDIVDAGLAFVNKANKLQDQFRARLMFPIFDSKGEPSASAGARSATTARSTRTRPRRRSTRRAGCCTGSTGRRARSSRAARSSSARATPT